MKSVDADNVKDLQAHFNSEYHEVEMYLAMAHIAEHEGYPEISETYKRYAFEEADHASLFVEMLGEVITDSTKKNLELRIEAEFGACTGETDITIRAKGKGPALSSSFFPDRPPNKILDHTFLHN